MTTRLPGEMSTFDMDGDTFAGFLTEGIKELDNAIPAYFLFLYLQAFSALSRFLET